MRTLEVRRHSERQKPGAHLNQAGVALARRVGASLGPFARVVTSDKPRAFETALAMGFAVDEQLEGLGELGAGFTDEVAWDAGFAAIAAALRQEGAVARYARKLLKLWSSLAETVPPGQALLVVSHGGIVECGAVAALPAADHAAWGGPLGLCEGVRLSFVSGRFTAGEVLRLPPA